MGKKRLGEPSQPPSLPKKTLRGSSSSNALSRTNATKDDSSWHQGLVFVNNAQKLEYETIGARKIR